VTWDVTLHHWARHGWRKACTEPSEEEDHFRAPIVPAKVTISRLLGLFAGSDLFDQVDDAAPELGVGDVGEGAGQRQTSAVARKSET
jgi:hypothetical protein